MKLAATILGLLVVFVGSVWVLQGIGVLPGSFMSGQPKWAIIGGIAVVAGVLLVVGARRMLR